MSFNNMFKRLRKAFYNRWYKNHPPEMVKYWQWKRDAALARVFKDKDGSYRMEIQGEDHVYPGFPRGHLLLSSLSKLKHECKNQFFNWAWAQLEEGVPSKDIIGSLKGRVLNSLITLSDSFKFFMVPYEKMVPPVKELWRAFEVIENKYPSKRLSLLKKMLCFILQEDDAYRFRVQWLFNYFRFTRKKDYVKRFEYALERMQHAEVVEDMKLRIRLLRRILMLILEDEKVKKMFTELFHELDWKKMRLSKADTYYFRGKYFKVDFEKYDY